MNGHFGTHYTDSISCKKYFSDYEDGTVYCNCLLCLLIYILVRQPLVDLTRHPFTRYCFCV